MTTKSQSAKQQQNEAIERLREWLKPGDTIYTILRHVSRSGMQREISLLYFGERSEPYDLDYNVAWALDARRGKRGVVASGCGMDMGFHLVYNLGRTLYPDGYGCVGEKCRSNDHSNGDPKGRVPHGCVDERHRDPSKRDPSCECGLHSAAEDHWHTDGGYAFNHKWL